MKKIQRKEKGITLITLIITVTVMLILAGVSIVAVVNGERGINKTKRAIEIYENATQSESDNIQNMIKEIYIERCIKSRRFCKL